MIQHDNPYAFLSIFYKKTSFVKYWNSEILLELFEHCTMSITDEMAQCKIPSQILLLQNYLFTSKLLIYFKKQY